MYNKTPAPNSDKSNYYEAWKSINNVSFYFLNFITAHIIIHKYFLPKHDQMGSGSLLSFFLSCPRIIYEIYVTSFPQKCPLIWCSCLTFYLWGFHSVPPGCLRPKRRIVEGGGLRIIISNTFAKGTLDGSLRRASFSTRKRRVFKRRDEFSGWSSLR